MCYWCQLEPCSTKFLYWALTNTRSIYECLAICHYTARWIQLVRIPIPALYPMLWHNRQLRGWPQEEGRGSPSSHSHLQSPQQLWYLAHGHAKSSPGYYTNSKKDQLKYHRCFSIYLCDKISTEGSGWIAPLKQLERVAALYMYSVHIDGFQMSIKHPTSGGQTRNQEAAVQQIFHLEKSSFFYLSALMVRTQCSAY